mmetsp:Transcript_37503/g.98363  ORF Transcript_37503/g.98363 Transcript_37503/m.98363 type:complete len:318 (+) Transcript_37503:1310-2263(+)
MLRRHGQGGGPAMQRRAPRVACADGRVPGGDGASDADYGCHHPPADQAADRAAVGAERVGPGVGRHRRGMGRPSPLGLRCRDGGRRRPHAADQVQQDAAGGRHDRARCVQQDRAGVGDVGAARHRAPRRRRRQLRLRQPAAVVGRLGGLDQRGHCRCGWPVNHRAAPGHRHGESDPVRPRVTKRASTERALQGVLRESGLWDRPVRPRVVPARAGPWRAPGDAVSRRGGQRQVLLFCAAGVRRVRSSLGAPCCSPLPPRSVDLAVGATLPRSATVCWACAPCVLRATASRRIADCRINPEQDPESRLKESPFGCSPR